ncbi:hypothetical protein [Leptospira stimsonii]|uniref:Uncharacterized protein n=1 Tax=Leptospira stimsonii TaxID=2202203 RepID=A0A396Z3P2_9LEPT|nr:hypothetical protein [Leptospira stimsonii]RHX90039.1 hypothetical protein DLM75_14020 [Leptospira stimsonii]
MGTRKNLFVSHKQSPDDFKDKEALKKFIHDKEIQDELGLVKSEGSVVRKNHLAIVFAELGQTAKAKQFLTLTKKIKSTKKRMMCAHLARKNDLRSSVKGRKSEESDSLC